MKLVLAFDIRSPISVLMIPNSVRHKRGVSSLVRKSTIFIVALLFVLAAGAHAHHASSSYLNLKLDGQSMTGQWDIPLLELERVIDLDADGDGNITRSEVEAKRTEIERYGLSRLRLEVDDVESPIQITGQLVDTFSDGDYNVLHFGVDCTAAPKTLKIDYRAFFDIDAQHRGLLRLECDGRVQTGVFSPEKPAQQFELTGYSPTRRFLAFVNEGAWHIWRGFDHILFLLALLLPSVLTRGPDGWRVVEHFRPTLITVLKVVTAFTVAHSLTLTLATLGVVRLPERLVESTIAVSVIFAALNNIRPIFPERGWIVAFGFGLVHGFGFANALFDLGLAGGALALTLVGFNLGVEAGQLAIVAVFVPPAFVWRDSWIYRELTFRFGSVVIVLLAATWMVERVLAIKVLPF
jgi:hypothetical protein